MVSILVIHLLISWEFQHRFPIKLRLLAVREVPIGKRTFIVRRPVVPVNEENVYVLQLLDLLKNLDVYLDESYDVAHDKVSQFVRIHGITKKDVDSYIREFPIAIFKYYYELRLDDVFA